MLAAVSRLLVAEGWAWRRRHLPQADYYNFRRLLFDMQHGPGVCKLDVQSGIGQIRRRPGCLYAALHGRHGIEADTPGKNLGCHRCPTRPSDGQR